MMYEHLPGEILLQGRLAQGFHRPLLTTAAAPGVPGKRRPISARFSG